MTIEINFQNPWLALTAPEVKTRKLPLSKLTSLDDHVHGTLAIVVAGRPLPMLGYLGPDDACLGDWAAELSNAARTLSSGDPSSYVYDEGEQGQPAFVFQRKGEIVSLSVSKSELGDGEGIPEWGVQCCELKTFVEQVRRFHDDLQAAIDRAAPGMAQPWMKHYSIKPT